MALYSSVGGTEGGDDTGLGNAMAGYSLAPTGRRQVRAIKSGHGPTPKSKTMAGNNFD